MTDPDLYHLQNKMVRGAAARTSIVGPNEIMTHDQIRSEIVTTEDLSFHVSDISFIQWLVIHRLLANSGICPNCHILLSFILYPRGIDGHKWRCKNCRKAMSIRKNSFFERSHLKLIQVIRIVFGWSQEYRHAHVITEARLGSATAHTIVDWFNFCRGICAKSLQRNAEMIGGFNENGSPAIVEINVFQLNHQKFHRGVDQESGWLFGGIERGTKKCFMVLVPDKTADILLPLILRLILPGSIIMSDDAESYRTIGELQGGIYEHLVLGHQHNFVIPDDPEIHTQNVKNMWMRLKRRSRQQFGTSKALFPSYLNEFQWRDQYPRNRHFPEFLRAISLLYPV